MKTRCAFCNIATHCPVKAIDINQDNVEEYYLCESCGNQYIQFHTEINHLNFNPSDTVAYFNAKPQLSCDCGLTKSEFERVGRFGCAKCYTFFKTEMKEIATAYHNAKIHLGKKPKKQTKENPEEIKKLLKLKFAKAIESEDYEEAATIKKELEKFNSP